MTNRCTSTSKDWLKSLLSRKRKRVKKKGEKSCIKGKKVKRGNKVKFLKENL